MSMQSEIIAIGPYHLMKELDLLDYDDRFYEGVEVDTFVSGTIASCNTTYDSKKLAEVVQIDIGNFSTHFIHGLLPYPITDQGEYLEFSPNLVIKKINKLLTWNTLNPNSKNKVVIFFRPNM